MKKLTKIKYIIQTFKFGGTIQTNKKIQIMDKSGRNEEMAMRIANASNPDQNKEDADELMHFIREEKLRELHQRQLD